MQKKSDLVLSYIGIIIGIKFVNFILGIFLNMKSINLGGYDIFLSSIVFILVVVIMKRKLYLSFKRENIKNILYGLIIGILFVSIIAIILKTFNLGIIKYNIGFNKETILSIIGIFINIVAIQIFLRGMIFNDLMKKFSVKNTFIIVAIFNIIINVNILITTPILIANTILFSFLITYFVYKYKSLELGIAFNFVFNIAGVYIIQTKGNEILSGGQLGIYSGLIVTILLSLVLLIIGIKDKVKLALQEYIVIALLVTLIVSNIGIYCSVWNSQKVVSSNTPIKRVEENKEINNYTLDWELDTKNASIKGKQIVDYINTSEESLDEVYFHMYAAAFTEYKGNIQIQSIKVNGINKDIIIEGQDNTLLQVTLDNGLKPKERAKIEMEYTINIPNQSDNGFGNRFSYSTFSFNIGNAFPIAAVYEERKWDKHPFDKKGDVFYSEVSNFDVNIKAPKEYELAVTGDVKNIKEDGNSKLWTVEANNVRDFALVASDKFEKVEANMNGTIIKSYASDKTKAEKVLGISANAIDVFSKRYGEYPYSTCSVVESDIGGGMEYPTMVMISSSSYRNVTLFNLLKLMVYGNIIGDLENIVVHELAHQWWYGIVGNDEFNEAWLDEPITVFSTLLYYKDIYGDEEFNKIYKSSIENIYIGYEEIGKNKSIKRPLNEFEEDEYTNLIYYKAPIEIMKEYRKLGDEEFNNKFRKLFEKYKFKILKGKDFPLEME